MNRRPGLLPLLALAAAVAVLLAACGGGEATATPLPKPTNTPVPTATPPTAAPTQAPPTATPTRPPATATPAPTATPTPQPGAQVPTPVTLPANKRGGTLVTRSLFQPIYWDTWEGFADVHVVAPMFNNLIHVDPYGDGKAIVGDAAERWQYSADGRSITFSLYKNIKFHDGTPMTAKDVAYNFDRGWKPRTPRGTYFKTYFAPIQQIETLDDYTVRIALSQPSNAFFQGLALAPFQIYPAAYPNPEKFADWKAKPFGTGPFKFKLIEKDSKMEYVRNEAYWKQGLPYLDGLQIIQLTPEAVVPAFRTGRLDATNLDTGAISNQIDDLKRATNFQARLITVAVRGVTFNNKAPWTDPKVREAVHLAMDRQAISDTALRGLGYTFASFLLAPELGGQWGIPGAELKTRPGWRQDKRDEDIARAKQLIAQAGIDPTKITVSQIGSSQLKVDMEAIEATFRTLGFKTRVEPLEVAPLNQRALAQDFDIYAPTTATIELDDPKNVAANLFTTDGVINYGKWSDAALDQLFLEQDKVLDVAKRKQLLLDLQERMLTLRWHIPALWSRAYVGNQPWVKNFNPNLPFLFQQQFRHEQVWLDR